MYTTPPVTALIVLCVVGILLITTVPLVAFAIYGEREITSPPADSVGDSVINNANEKP